MFFFILALGIVSSPDLTKGDNIKNRNIKCHRIKKLNKEMWIYNNKTITIEKVNCLNIGE